MATGTWSAPGLWRACRRDRAGPLDFGCGDSWLGLAAARKGYAVTALYLRDITWPYVMPSMNFIRGDLLKKDDFAPLSLDLIINCSSVEHVGLPDRYGSGADPDGDFKAMTVLHSLLRPGGVMLMTVPVGRDTVFPPLHRVYGAERLPRLLRGWTITDREFWVKDDRNRWTQVAEAEAMDREPARYCYGLGCFVLRRD